MKYLSRSLLNKIALPAALGLIGSALCVQASSQRWAPAGVNTNWSTTSNWTLAGSPAGNDLTFTNVSATVAITNVVDQNFSINSLLVLSNTYTTKLPSTLTITGAGGLTIGDTNSGVSGTNIVIGGGGLVVNNANANFVVGPGCQVSATELVDMSALTNLSATVSNFVVGGSMVAARCPAGIFKCPTNTSITATRLLVGDSLPSSAIPVQNPSGTSSLNLSRVGPNVINVDSIFIGHGKASGTLQFNSVGSGGSLTLLNRAGTGPVGTTEVGERTEANSNSGETGTVIFDSAAVNAQFLTFNLAHNLGAANANNNVCAGTLTLGSGLTSSSLVAINTLNVTKSDSTLAATGVFTENGTINVNGGTLAATNLNLCQLTTGTLGTSYMNATINVGGGTLLFGNALTPTAGTFVTNNFQYGTIASVDNAARALPATQVNLGKIGTNAPVVFGQASGGTGALTFSGTISLVTNVTLQTVQNTTLSGLISGGFYLVKTGAANLTLNGTNTYTGATTNFAGTLFGVSGGSIASTVTVAPTTGNSAGLGVVVNNNTVSWANNGVVFQSGGTGTTLSFNYGATPLSATVPAMQVNGNVDFTGTPTVIIQASSLSNGQYALMSWTGTQTGPNPTTVSLPPRVTGYLSVSANTLYLNVTGYSGPVQWASGNGTWNINNSGNNVWLDNASNPTYYQEQFGQGDAVVLNDAATSGTPTLTLNTTVSPTALTVNSTNNYTISGSGSIAGTVALTKANSGSLTLGTANSFSGGTTLNAGQLNINNGGSSAGNSAIGTGTLTVNGGTIDNTSGSDVAIQAPVPQTWNSDIIYLGSANSLNLGAGAVTINTTTTNQNVTVGANTLTIGGNIGPVTNYTISKFGSGTLALGGFVNFTNSAVYVENGAVQLLSGTNQLNTGFGIQLGNTNSTGKLILGSAAGVANQAVMVLTVATNCPLLSNSVVGGNASISTLTLSNLSNVSLTFGGSLGGPGVNENNLAVTKANFGGYGLTGTNTYTGVTRINQGLLDFRIKPALYNGNTNSWTTANIIVASNAVFGLGIGAAGYFSTADVQFFQNFGTTTGGLLSGAILGLDPAGGDYTYGGVVTDIVVPGVTTNILGLTALSSNVVTLTATNTYTGGTYAGFYGTLRIAGQGCLPQNKLLTLGAFSGTGTLQYDSTATSTFANANIGNGTVLNGVLNQTAGTISIPGTMTLGAGTSASFYGTVNVSGGSLNVNTVFNGATAWSPNNITVGGTGSLVVSNGYSVGRSGGNNATGYLTQNGGNISVAGNMNLARYDSGKIRISTNNLNGGTLSVDTIYAEGTDGSLPTTNIAILNFNGGTLKATMSSTLVSGLTAAYVKTNGAIIDDGGNSVSITQALLDDGTGIGGLTKQGAGTLTLTANNTYYGATLINSGTLTISSGSMSNSSAINLAGGATLDVSGAPSFVVQSAQTLTGSGTVNGSLTINGTLAPGASVGTLTFANNLTVNGNLAMDLNKSLSPSNDIVNVTGTLVNTGTGTLTVNNLGPALSVGDKFKLFNQAVSGGNAITIVPPSGVTFTNKLAVDGSIEVLTAASPIASYSTNITSSISGSTLTVSWPATHLGWILQSQTNALTVGLGTNWVDIAGTASVTTTNLTISPATPTAFFRLRHP